MLPKNKGTAQEKPLRFADFLNRHAPHIHHYPHIAQLIAVLQRVADGELKRLMVFMPPRHGKSEIVSRWFPAYMLYRFPEKWVAIASYGSGLAYTLSRNARDNYSWAGGPLKDDAREVKHWETGKGGGLWAAGVGGSATGKGGHTMIVDDPLKDAEEAASITIREKHKDWWRSTWYTRLEPDAAMVVVQTRWNEDDLSGWLLSQEAGEEPEGWHIVNMPAIKEGAAIKIPPSCTLEEDSRPVGTALCDERYPINKLKKIRARVGSYYWSALYQQTPSPNEGGLFKRHWWRFWVPVGVELPPYQTKLADGTWHTHIQTPLPDRLDERLQSWDMAFKEKKDADFVVGQDWGRKGADKFLLAQSRGRMDFVKTVEAVRELASLAPSGCAKLVEAKANGPAVVSALRHEVAGLIEIEPDGGKVARATAVTPQVEAGNVYLPHPAIAPWVDEYINELATFPNATNDDQVDSTSQALSRFELSEAVEYYNYGDQYRVEISPY